MKARVLSTTVAALDAEFELSDAEIAELIEPLGLAAGNAAILSHYIWHAKSLYLGRKMLAHQFEDFATSRATVVSIADHADAIRAAVGRVDPHFLVGISIMVSHQRGEPVENGTFSVPELCRQLTELSVAARAVATKMKRGPGRRDKETLRETMKIVARGIKKATGAPLRSGQSLNSVRQLHLKGPEGALVKRLFHRLDSTLTEAELVGALRRSRNNGPAAGETP
jgi:hypothetical protein